eukprot:CAMPEP_0172184368 /NCGR_PEP_ID=MMETSP1050-20130122/19534_1 /TAXON_ID=233186 /ORGANISM="Cryptomonas curvata, Strain CCAP979/52" /LENGTH=380 /DNA_ID=CAMNT_0012858153 /DNA_START=209 /DNA_END=1352 /DNA_ORIENTATION=+
MQPLKELPAPAQLWKDKFLIQAAYVLEEDAEGTDAKTIFEKVRKEDLVDQKLNCSFELPSAISSLGALTAVAESPPPIPARVPHRTDALSASPAMGGSNHSSGFEAAGESLHRSEFERSLEASTRYSELGDETSERESGASVRDQNAGGRDVEKELLEKLQLERRHAERLAKELQAAKEREKNLLREVREQQQLNKDAVDALSDLQQKFQQLQTKSRRQDDDRDRRLGTAAPPAGSQQDLVPKGGGGMAGLIQSALMAAIVVLVAVLVAKSSAPDPAPLRPRWDRVRGAGPPASRCGEGRSACRRMFVPLAWPVRSWLGEDGRVGARFLARWEGAVGSGLAAPFVVPWSRRQGRGGGVWVFRNIQATRDILGEAKGFAKR